MWPGRQQVIAIQAIEVALIRRLGQDQTMLDQPIEHCSDAWPGSLGCEPGDLADTHSSPCPGQHLQHRGVERWDQ